MNTLLSFALRAAAVCVTALAFACTSAPATASGTLQIRQSNAHVDVYKNVTVKVIHGALYLTSADGKGTIVVHRAACSYQGKLLVCAPVGGALVQKGETGPFKIVRGTVYLNDTGDPQPLLYSSAKVPPHGVILSLTTEKGTLITMNGKIDGVTRR